MVRRVSNHGSGNIRTKLFDLFSDVAKKSVAAPTTQQHDSIDGNAVEVHGHCCGSAKGVKADVIGLKSVAVAIDAEDKPPKPGESQFSSQMHFSPGGSAISVGVDVIVHIKTFMLHPLNDGGGDDNWTIKRVTGALLGDGVVADVLLLPFERDGNEICLG